MPFKLGDLLLKENIVTPQQLQDALDHQKQNGGTLERALVRLRILKDDEITSLLSRHLGVPSIKLGDFEVDPAIIKLIPAETARKYQVLPLSRHGKTLTLAMADPTNTFAMDKIKFMNGFNIEPVLAWEVALEKAINRYYSPSRAPDAPSLKEVIHGSALTFDDMASVGLSEVDLDSMADAEADFETVKTERDEIDLGAFARSSDAPVIKLSNVVLIDALKRGASDIHIEPYEEEFRVRYRIDGVLYNAMALPMKLRDPLVSRVKLMAKMDIAEKRLPQSGRIKLRLKVEERKRDLDFRVSTMPTLWGEMIVLHLLDKPKLILDMTQMGFEPPSLERFRSALSKRNGMVLVTGPRRSGKTNTLHAAVVALNKPDVHVMTAEYPVDLPLVGINHIQIRDNIGLSFAGALRCASQLDADVILVGEIRDRETAEIATSLAQHGHLVLSTLPTADAPSAASHMVKMGIEPFLVATALSLIVAQRLVRRVCTNCKVDKTGEVSSGTLITTGFKPEEIGSLQVFKGEGCAACHGTGYKGFVGLFEAMEVTDGIRDLITTGATALQMRNKAVEEGMITLRMSGLEKIRNGVTTIEEVLRETAL